MDSPEPEVRREERPSVHPSILNNRYIPHAWRGDAGIAPLVCARCGVVGPTTEGCP